MIFDDRSATGFLQMANHLARIKIQCLCDVEKLNDIEAAFSSFVLADERLQTIETFAENGLGDARRFAGIRENSDELDVCLAVG